MNRKVSSLAIEVIRQADREHPADGVLRQVLKAERRLSREQQGEVADAVFAYYRWKGWLNADYPFSQQIVYASKLQSDFNANPLSIAEKYLHAKAVPSWIRGELKVTTDWLKSLQTPPKVWLRCKPGTRDRVAANLKDCEQPDTPSDALIYCGNKDLFLTPGFKSGDFELQDVNSQRVGLIAAPSPGETWWDACAGQGGKTVHLSNLMQNRGLIWASDRAEWRLKKLKQRAARSGMFNYRSALWDGGASLPTKTKFDGILLDAPCSGIGTWHRNPHARWTCTPEDVKELARLQFELLDHAAPALKPGGRLVYSVCTVSRSETLQVANRFTQSHQEMKPMPAEGTDRGFLWPQTTCGNGMFIAVWTKS